MLFTALKTLVCVSKSCPRLPTVSLECALPFLGMSRDSKMTQMILQTYEVYTNVNDTLNSFQQHINLCYYVYKTGKSTYRISKGVVRKMVSSKPTKQCSDSF